MPTLSNINLPTPKSWEEFEEITLDALKIKWDNPNLQKNGRTGQSQNGVDIYGHDYYFQFTGIQCKKYDDKLSIKTIEEEILKAESFIPELEIFIIATTNPTDATLQKEIRLISKKRKEIKKFAVGILFWNDIVQELITNEKIFKKHFPQINIDTFQRKTPKRLFSLFDLSFFGLYLKHFSDVFFGEFGFLAQEDPRKIEAICSIIESSCLATCSDEEQKKIVSKVQYFLSYLLPYITGINQNNFYWKTSNENADRVADQIINIEHSLTGDELLIFKIGELLGYWNKYEFEKGAENPISNEILIKLSNYISKLNSDKLPQSINLLIEQYKRNDSVANANIPSILYKKLKQILIESEIIK